MLVDNSVQTVQKPHQERLEDMKRLWQEDLCDQIGIYMAAQCLSRYDSGRTD